MCYAGINKPREFISTGKTSRRYSVYFPMYYVGIDKQRERISTGKTSCKYSVYFPMYIVGIDKQRELISTGKTSHEQNHKDVCIHKQLIMPTLFLMPYQMRRLYHDVLVSYASRRLKPQSQTPQRQQKC